MTHDYTSIYVLRKDGVSRRIEETAFIKYSLLGILLFLPFLIFAFWLMGSFFTTIYQMVLMGGMSDEMAAAMLMSNMFDFFFAIVISGRFAGGCQLPGGRGSQLRV